MTANNRLAILVARGNDAMAGKPEDPGALKVFHLERPAHERRLGRS